MRLSSLSPFVAVPVAAGLLAGPVAAQGPPSVSGTVSVAPKVSRATLRKGMPVRVGCSAACDVSVTLAGPTGVITSKSVRVAAGATKTVELRARAFQVQALERGAKLYVTVNAGGFMSPAIAQDSTRLR
jgi:hypothetical protein